MSFLNKFVPDKKKIIPYISVSLFFLAYLFLGYSVYKDYGISMDEPMDYQRGLYVNNYMQSGDKQAFIESCKNIDDFSCDYPSLFSLTLYRLAPSGTSQSIYLHRHQYTFAFFAFSVFVFFLIGRKLFKDWKIGLLGALFLIISPRIFAHSFYNPKDIPFLSAYIIASFTLLLFLEKKNIFTALLHGLAVGAACAIRTPGIILLPITGFFYLFDLLLAREKLKAYLKGALFLVVLGALAAVVIYIFSPSLYGNPIGGYIEVFKVMRQFPWSNYQLYMGQNISNHIPWHYSLVWFAISSPFFYVALFLLGILVLAVKTFQSRHIEQFQSLRDLYVAASLGILPIIVVIVGKSVIYTENRQMYFVYPALLLVSLYGLVKLAQKLRSVTRYWQVGLALILAAGLASPVYFMLRYHPYEYTYFNFLAGPSMSAIKEKFPLDTWGVSPKAALEYILKTDPSPKITILVFDAYLRNMLILPAEQNARLSFIIANDENQGSPDYILTFYRNYPQQQVTRGKVYYSIKVGDADVCTVYKLKKN